MASDPWVNDAPLLAGLSAASVQGVTTLGPRSGRGPTRLGNIGAAAEIDALVPGSRAARANGFSLHAGLVVPAGQCERLERVCRYVLRPPVAIDRLHLTDDGRVRLSLRHPWSDGTTDLVFTPQEFLERLAVLVPRPRINLILYFGVLGARATARAEVAGRGCCTSAPRARAGHGAESVAASGEPAESAGGRNRSWAVLMQRTFGLDVLACPRCGGRVRLIALIEQPGVIKRVLGHLGLPTELPAPAVAERPQSIVAVRRSDEVAMTNMWLRGCCCAVVRRFFDQKPPPGRHGRDLSPPKPTCSKLSKKFVSDLDEWPLAYYVLAEMAPLPRDLTLVVWRTARDKHEKTCIRPRLAGSDGGCTCSSSRGWSVSMRNTKKTLGILLGCLAALVSSQPAEGALFVRISANADSLTCDNGTAAGVAACTANGFVTSLDFNSILLTPFTTVGGYNFGGLQVTANVPGSSLVSFATDSQTSVTHLAGAGDLTIDYGAYNFTVPPGPAMDFSASQTANWTSSVSTDSSAFTAWARADNGTIVPGGGVGGSTAATATIVSPGGVTVPVSSQSGSVLFTRLATPFSLTGREVIHLAIGSIGNFQGTATVTPVAAVPEPASMLLLGTGLAALAAGQARRRLRKK